MGRNYLPLLPYLPHLPHLPHLPYVLRQARNLVLPLAAAKANDDYSHYSRIDKTRDRGLEHRASEKVRGKATIPPLDWWETFAPAALVLFQLKLRLRRNC
jgi:hypothetical protein